MKRKIKFKTVNGLRQNPRELDFHITPVLTFARADKKEVGDLGSAWGICLEWGHWAVGFGIYTIK